MKTVLEFLLGPLSPQEMAMARAVLVLFLIAILFTNMILMMLACSRNAPANRPRLLGNRRQNGLFFMYLFFGILMAWNGHIENVRLVTGSPKA